MIVRIMEGGQFHIDDPEQLVQLDTLDDALHAATQAEDQVEFAQALGQLITFIKTNGRPVPYTEIVPSDVIVPAEDMTLAEAAQLLVPVPEAPQAE